jgi:hypothetical protein
LARELAHLVALALPSRRVYLLGDSAYVNASVLRDRSAKIGYSENLHARHLVANGKKAGLARERAALLQEPDDVPELPPLEELKSRARVEVGRMEFGDPEFGRTMHRLLPRIEVFPYQLLDGGKVVLRARVTIDMAPLLGSAGGAFDEPPSDRRDRPVRAAPAGGVPRAARRPARGGARRA